MSKIDALEVVLGNQVVGTARFTRRRNRLSTTFEYARDYLGARDAYAIDPELPFYSGAYHVDGLPKSFADAAPDRWGRRLIDKEIRQTALREGRTPPTIDDGDYLLGVSDYTRQGALRFRVPGTDEFLGAHAVVPKLVELPRLLSASDAVVRDPDDFAAVKALLAAGTGTLGGARPKASVRDGESLYIAKFSKPGDEWDVMAWEATALDLAGKAGITVPKHRLERIDGRGVLLLSRFDRDGDQRIGYVSAMTLMGGKDGTDADYVELAEQLTEFSADVKRDLEELWRRIAFSIAIHNTDDHLRNHGFLRKGKAWNLSPAFDVNPNPDLGEGRTTSIGGATYPQDEMGGLLNFAEVFRVRPSRQGQILDQVLHAISEWDSAAARNGVPDNEIERFHGSFTEMLKRVADAAKTHPAAPAAS